ncbi:unnamed protein product [Callosobruchus maculatus]|uniref:Tyr recombinase domain-containing protein n=1 Tax=Callosobruchus maculatus TaxID=64391 RepID=A0A653BTH6_CALMS|nr:unnamed protein product [Callosobruchus maculatus]
MLISLVTSHRVQTLSKIKLGDIKLFGSEYKIFISELTKTSSPNKQQPILRIPRFNEKPEICVARTLEYYMKVTSPYRKDTQFLFPTYKKPHHRATAQTISRWLKDVLNKSGIDTSLFKAHSVRHAASSAAFRAGANIECIRNAAGWTEKSNTFAKFYNRPLNTEKDFAESVVLLE